MAKEGCAATELEIKRWEELTPSNAWSSPHVETLKISCLVKATDSSGLPANGMSLCHETAHRLPTFFALFPKLEEVHLGGYSKAKDDGDSEPFFFSLTKEALRRHHADNKSNPDQSIKAIFDLTINLCEAYRMGFLPKKVKIIGLFDAADRFGRYNLLCEDKVNLDTTGIMRDGKSCETCRKICQSINLQQALELKCAEETEGSHNYLGRLEFLGCQLCITSKTKFKVISSREDFRLDLFKSHLIKTLSNEEKVYPENYVCDDKGSPAQDGKKRGKMLRYAQECTDCTVASELDELLNILKGKIGSRDIVDAIVRNNRSNSYMIDGKIFITSGTWSYMKAGIDAHDTKKFEVVDEEIYGLWGMDMVYEKEPWRGDE